MSLTDRIETDLTAAMKDAASDRTAVLRLLKASLKNEQIKLGHELSDDEVTKVLTREAKQRRDSIEAYQQGGRAELAASEQAELTIIADYLPEQMDEAALAKIIDQVVTQLGATDASQMGSVMGKVMAQVGSAADGGTVSRLVRERLAR